MSSLGLPLDIQIADAHMQVAISLLDSHQYQDAVGGLVPRT